MTAAVKPAPSPLASLERDLGAVERRLTEGTRTHIDPTAAERPRLARDLAVERLSQLRGHVDHLRARGLGAMDPIVAAMPKGQAAAQLGDDLAAARRALHDAEQYMARAERRLRRELEAEGGW